MHSGPRPGRNLVLSETQKATCAPQKIHPIVKFMKSFVKSLLAARAEILEDHAQLVASLQKKLGHLDALLAENDVDVAKLGSIGAPAKRRGRKPSTEPKVPGKPGRPKGKRGKRAQTDFNATAAVRAIVADTKGPFTVKELRDEFEKRHPGVLAKLNRVVLSLAMQSLGRRGEVTSKKDPNGKGNLFTKTAKLTA